MAGRAGRAGVIAVSFGVQGAMIAALGGLVNASHTSVAYGYAAPQHEVMLLPMTVPAQVITVTMNTEGQQGFAILPGPGSAVPANATTFLLKPGGMVMTLDITIPAGDPVDGFSLSVLSGPWASTIQPGSLTPLLTVDGPVAAGQHRYTVRWPGAGPRPHSSAGLPASASLMPAYPTSRLVMTVQQPDSTGPVTIAEFTSNEAGSPAALSARVAGRLPRLNGSAFRRPRRYHEHMTTHRQMMPRSRGR